MSVIDLGAVQLAENRPTWLHAFPMGEYRHPMHGLIKFTRERLERFANNIRQRTRGIDLAIDWEHGTDPSKGKRAAGWITDAEVRSDGLYIAATFTDEAKHEIRAGHWRYLSPEYQDHWEDNQGHRFQDVLFGAALTNRPFLKDLAPIAAHERTANPVFDIPTVLRDLRQQLARSRQFFAEREPPRVLNPGAAFMLAAAVKQEANGLTNSQALRETAKHYPELYDAYVEATELP
jgi:phage I-like protein